MQRNATRKRDFGTLKRCVSLGFVDFYTLRYKNDSFSARTHSYAPFGAALASRRVGQPLQTQIIPSNVQL